MEPGDKQGLEQQVSEIYRLLRELEYAEADSNRPWSHPETPRIFVRYVVAPFLIVVALGLFIWWFGNPSDALKLAFLVMLVIIYICIGAVQLMELYAERIAISKFFKNPMLLIMDGLIATSSRYLNATKILKQCTSEALQHVRIRLDYQKVAVERRLGVLVGALETVGLIPGLITVLLAAFSQELKSEKLAMGFAIATVTIYTMAFTLHQVLPRLGLYSTLITAILEERKGAGK
jgi:hypothetical protein